MNAYDALIVGGGPGGLQAALSLGRARKQVLLCDAGPRRNAMARGIHNFVTRDGTPPDEFRRVGRAQLATYPDVHVRETGVAAILGERGAFRATLADGTVVDAKRVLLTTGMIDEELPIPGFREQWGRSIFQCPYCHGWEVQDRPWGFLVTPQSLPHAVPFALQARGWTADLTVFLHGLVLPADALARLAAAAIRVEPAVVARIGPHTLELADGRAIPCDALFAHPPQHQTPLVTALDLALEDGLVKIDSMRRETSVPGIYAAGDLTTRMQGAILAAASAAHAAAMLNVDLAMELGAPEAPHAAR